MAKFFLITYDLKKTEQNYTELYDSIKGYGEWQHPLESTWIVKVSSQISSNEIYNHIRPQMNENDSLFVVDITGQDRQGWLAKTFWEWMK